MTDREIGHEADREYMLKDRDYDVMFQDGDWIVGDLGEKMKYPGHPLIGHFCKKSWNYVFSSSYAKKAFRGSVLYKCSGCDEMAPDHIITIHELALE